MVWKIEFDPAAERELSKLDPPIARRILAFLYKRVAALDDPRCLGEALKGSKLGDFWKYRIGDYRLIVNIEDAGSVGLII
ncbi:mRNA interferase RelE/StbE [Allochromatium warmingii]|uniref:mRNA interferase RelE/StbE n=1 Tax=Allochromatium warmingii TaxID=61595 RepID=A0A1H3JBS8_ALLWA|nr:type II toxin-antitoxin system RelE/ParE family toxin [Allochromatium warmingii]SDY37372.1 mRNA interferase RelE/StbE [Allochromatium warmingii]